MHIDHLKCIPLGMEGCGSPVSEIIYLTCSQSVKPVIRTKWHASKSLQCFSEQRVYLSQLLHPIMFPFCNMLYGWPYSEWAVGSYYCSCWSYFCRFESISWHWYWWRNHIPRFLSIKEIPNAENNSCQFLIYIYIFYLGDLKK